MVWYDLQELLLKSPDLYTPQIVLADTAKLGLSLPKPIQESAASQQDLLFWALDLSQKKLVCLFTTSKFSPQMQLGPSIIHIQPTRDYTRPLLKQYHAIV